MKLSFVLDGDYNRIWQEKLQEISNSDIVVFGFNGMGLVSYKKELSGESEYFQDITKLSRELKNVIISGCDTDTYGNFRHSAVISDTGKLLGVSDMTHSLDTSEFIAGGNYKVYDTTKGKIGIIVCDDIYFFEVAKTLSLCDADMIISITKTIDDIVPQIMTRAFAFSFGVPIALVSDNYVSIVDNSGKVIISGSNGIIKTKINIQKEFRQITTKFRGFF